jgi:hypothetical protein
MTNYVPIKYKCLVPYHMMGKSIELDITHINLPKLHRKLHVGRYIYLVHRRQERIRFLQNLDYQDTIRKATLYNGILTEIGTSSVEATTESSHCGTATKKNKVTL